MKMIPGTHDSRGRESKTLTMVTVSWFTLLVKFAGAGLTLPVVGEFPVMSANEFGLATAAILAIWLGREWKEKAKANAE
jgi:hypothetical protein